ncbi:hypothetical protein [uncultured Psychroserpens sp.]|uniref:HYC_CC_PP family protein n=1 Tax=uncultured Psychroserpens sp. TaxID=255436 RepID=UPI00262D6F2D|nr:hypothetical protein [uncultured Psychroserpens sp.]
MFSVLMAILVLFSTVSFTVEKHFCGDVLIDAAVFTEAQKCKMEAFEIEQSKITKKSCCKDVKEIVKGQDQLKQSKFEELSIDDQVFITSFVVSYIDLLSELPKLIVPHKNYSPPNLVTDIQVIDQVFLI